MNINCVLLYYFDNFMCHICYFFRMMEDDKYLLNRGEKKFSSLFFKIDGRNNTFFIFSYSAIFLDFYAWKILYHCLHLFSIFLYPIPCCILSSLLISIFLFINFFLFFVRYLLFPVPTLFHL